VLYYYQTNAAGRYAQKPGHPRNMEPNELGQTHGYIRGWVRTGPDGRYAIRTIRPGAYPSNDEVAHIHATIQEPDRATYYIDDFIFDDDPLLTTAKRLRLENRCGSGELRLVRKNGLLVGERNIILGQNIPGYAGTSGARAEDVEGASAADVRSGNQVGEDVFSFTPFHAWGPDKGSRTCPVCKYGWYHGVLYFVGDKPDWADIKRWLTFLEAECARRKDRLSVYFVYGSQAGYRDADRTRELEALGRELNLERIALTHVPSFSDEKSDVHLNHIDPGVGNTMILYKRSRIIAKAIDLQANEAGFRWIQEQLNDSSNEYFDLPKPSKEIGSND
jgi:protocatechuate 3,4-dioxygenase beta subunit